jgi:hypothetical protein
VPRRRLSPREKSAAAEQLQACRDAEADYGLVVVVVAPLAAAGGLLLPYGLAAALLGAVLRRYTRSVERAVEDPPRPDVQTRTRAVPPRLYPDRVLGDTPIEQAAAQAVNGVKNASAFLSAYVRSVERTQGAELIGAREYADLHSREAAEFASRLAQAAQMSAEAFALVGTEFEAHANEAKFPPIDLRQDTVIWDLLPNDVAKALRRAGMTRDDLATLPPAQSTSEAFSFASASSYDVSRTFRLIAAETAAEQRFDNPERTLEDS